MKKKVTPVVNEKEKEAAPVLAKEKAPLLKQPPKLDPDIPENKQREFR